MITRKIGGLLRGSATPAQLIIACILGALLGFTPGFDRAPGLIIILIILLAILKANVWLALIVALISKGLAWLATPLTFTVGRFFIDGPTQGLLKSIINAPVLALCGFEYYVTPGGLVMGLIFGTAVGLGVTKLIGGFRRKMAVLEEGSDRYKAWTSKGWVKALTWIFAGGGHGKKKYADLLEHRVGNPIRTAGVVFAGIVVLALIGVRYVGTGPILARVLRGGLERANGATVDLADAQVDIGNGRIALNGLALADPKALDTNLLGAIKVEAKISTSDLLRKRIQLDHVVISDASQGDKRKTRGKLVGPQPLPLPDEGGAGKTLEDYLKDAQAIRQRLTQIRDWLDKISKPKTDEPAPGKNKDETLKERLDRLIREEGYARVKADHLLEGAPTLTIIELRIEKLRASPLPGQTFDIDAENLSTQPHLLAKAPTIKVTSSDGSFSLALNLVGSSALKGTSTVNLACTGIPMQKVAGGLAGDAKSASGGTVDFRTAGTFDNGRVNLPVTLKVQNISLGDGKSPLSSISALEFPVAIRGPIDSPRIEPDMNGLTQALIAAGKDELAKQLQSQLGKVIPKDLGKVIPKGLDGVLPKGVGDLLPKGKDKGDKGGKGLLDGLLPTSKPKKKD